eukprot:2465904-Rhodomonas_salina.1
MLLRTQEAIGYIRVMRPGTECRAFRSPMHDTVSLLMAYRLSAYGCGTGCFVLRSVWLSAVARMFSTVVRMFRTCGTDVSYLWYGFVVLVVRICSTEGGDGGTREHPRAAAALSTRARDADVE